MSSGTLPGSASTRQEWLAREYPRDDDHLADSAAEYEDREGRPPETLAPSKDREKICRLCNSRVTVSKNGDREFGHRRTPITVAGGRFVFEACPFACERGDGR